MLNYFIFKKEIKNQNQNIIVNISHVNISYLLNKVDKFEIFF